VKLLINTEEFLGNYSFEDAEQILLAMKDLLYLKLDQRLIHNFMNSLLSSHGRLLELYGEEIFESILKEDGRAEDKLHVRIFVILDVPIVHSNENEIRQAF